MRFFKAWLSLSAGSIIHSHMFGSLSRRRRGCWLDVRRTIHSGVCGMGDQDAIAVMNAVLHSSDALPDTVCSICVVLERLDVLRSMYSVMAA